MSPPAISVTLKRADPQRVTLGHVIRSRGLDTKYRTTIITDVRYRWRPWLGKMKSKGRPKKELIEEVVVERTDKVIARRPPVFARLMTVPELWCM
ncbi:MAG TPA: hypothetical protein VG099_05990 [Gemmataceae bacterium]|nr:hypothetical protein [Gemmataceae bacterium]